MPLTALSDWIAVILGNSYKYVYGPWEETLASADAWYCAVQAAGGPASDVDVRRPRWRVILLGPRNSRGSSETIMTDAELLLQAALSSGPPCGAAHIRAIGEVVGPGFTTENRAWAQLSFQTII